MNTLSYFESMQASLVRYDMSNQMLRYANLTLDMSQRQQRKYNFRRFKKFLKTKGWAYSRPYPLKGKDKATVKLLDIVTKDNADSFMVKHGDLSSALLKGDIKIIMHNFPEEDANESR